MIVQVCGTNGSGKSTAVRKVIAQSQERETLTHNGKEYGKLYDLPGADRPLVIAGRYHDINAVGCDAIKDYPSQLEFIRGQHEAGRHVLFEGIRMMSHTGGIAFSKLVGPCNMTTLLLSTTLAECLAGIHSRQIARHGVTKEVSKDVESNITRARNYAFKLSEIGVKKVLASRDEAPGIVLDLLRRSRS